MSWMLAHLRTQRGELVVRCEEERARLLTHAARVQRLATPFELGFAAARTLRSHPLAIAAAVLAVSLRPRGRILRWLSTGLTAYSVARRLAVLLRAR